MESSLLEALLEYGAMGLFAAFLIWQHLSMQKRFDKLYESFKTQLKDLQEKSEKNEDKLRTRYDDVIKQYQDDKTTFRINVAEQINSLRRDVEKFATAVDDLPFDSLQIQIEAVSLNQNQSHRMLEKGMEALRAIQEEQKLKAMARKLKDSESS
tara:strand:- start:1453 stop:1914 length:462 start_codon:yes stop_codon:yes gene_type:complete